MHIVHPLAAAIAVLMIFGLFRPSPAAGAEDAQSRAIMQCMEQCIRNEGEAEKATCKARCAKLPSVFDKKPPQSDCMAVYKACIRDCKKDKTCLRNCKQNLMQCS